MQLLFLMYRGPKWSAAASELAAHAEYTSRLRRDRKVDMSDAAPDNDEPRGMIVFNSISDDEAQRLIAADPASTPAFCGPNSSAGGAPKHVIPN